MVPQASLYRISGYTKLAWGKRYKSAGWKEGKAIWLSVGPYKVSHPSENQSKRRVAFAVVPEVHRTVWALNPIHEEIHQAIYLDNSLSILPFYGGEFRCGRYVSGNLQLQNAGTTNSLRYNIQSMILKTRGDFDSIHSSLFHLSKYCRAPKVESYPLDCWGDETTGIGDRVEHLCTSFPS